MDQHLEAIDHLRKAAALLDHKSPHVASEVRRIAAKIATNATATSDYRQGRATVSDGM
jgi:hypothetical protein